MFSTLKLGNSLFNRQARVFIKHASHLKQSRPTYATHSRFPPPTQYKPPSQLTNGRYTRFQQNQPFYMSKRLWVFLGTGTVIFGGYYVTHLENVPISGRKRFMNITPRQEEGKDTNKHVLSC